MRQPDDWTEEEAVFFKQQQEIEALKAQVEELKTCLELTLECTETMGDESFVIFVGESMAIKYVDILNQSQDALDKTPHQCLADVRADAVEFAAKTLAKGLLISPQSEREILEYAQQLRNNHEKS